MERVSALDVHKMVGRKKGRMKSMAGFELTLFAILGSRANYLGSCNHNINAQGRFNNHTTSQDSTPHFYPSWGKRVNTLPNRLI